MLWVALVFLGVVAVGWRVAMRARPQIWWISFTLSLLFIAVASAILAQEPAVDRALGLPTVGYLLSNLAFTVAGGSVQVYVHTLRSVRPVLGWIWVHVGTAVVVILVQWLGWLAAPVHESAYPIFRDVPVTLETHGFEVVFHVYMGAVVANVAAGAFGQLRHAPAEDPGRRWGLWVITLGAGIDVAAQALYLIRLALQPAIGRRPDRSTPRDTNWTSWGPSWTPTNPLTLRLHSPNVSWARDI